MGDGSIGPTEGVCVASKARHRQDHKQKTGNFLPVELRLTVTVKKKNLPIHLVLNSINNLMQLDYSRIGECKVNQ